MSIKIALAGNPNSGKTTMFNDLTGSSQYVGNWPGVTVEKKEGKLRSNKEVVIQDLPGIYSLSPYTLEEVVSRNYLIKDRPDAIINIVDASNIERNLYLTTQLAEIGLPMVLALNMIDIVKKNGDVIDINKLGELLGCQVVETSALKREGSQEVVEKALAAANTKAGFQPQHAFSTEVEGVLEEIEKLIRGKILGNNTRWYAIKLFERDAEVMKDLTLDTATLQQVEDITSRCEEEMDDDSESIITNERYDYINAVMKKCVKHKNKGGLTTSDKIDKIVTNRILALPIFVVVMFLVYFVSISTVGTWMTDWVNEALFDEGFHLFGMGAGEYGEVLGEFEEAEAVIEAYIEAAGEAGYNVEAVTGALELNPEEFGDKALFEIAKTGAEEDIEAFLEMVEDAGIVTQAEILNEDREVEAVLTVTHGDFVEALEVEEPDPADYGVFVTSIPDLVEEGLESIGTAGWLTGLIVDGIIAGVGAVLGFLPQMLVLFLCLAFLEDCGYMSRIAFIMDRIFRKFGLSGKSFIPILVGTGCGVPGIMASRTIESDNDRRMTVITTTFIPCGAKLPIIALISGALLGGQWWVAPSAYFLGITAIIVSGIMLKKTKLFAGDPAPFVMELPAYHMPGLKGVMRTMWQRGWSFIKKAGTIVLLATVGVWFLSSFSWSMEMVDTNDSMLAAIGGVIAPLFAPLGWGHWQGAVATLTGLIAKENVVGTFGVLFEYGEVSEDGFEIWNRLSQAFTPLAAYSFLAFNLLCAPCFAAIGAVRREMMSGKWTWFAIGFQCALAYAVALIIYQMGLLFTGNGFGVGTIFAFACIALIIFLLVRKPYQEDHTIKASKPHAATK